MRLFTIVILFFAISAKARSTDTVEVSQTKTVYLVFEKSVLQYEVDSPDIVVEAEKNTIKLKSNIKDFSSTSLRVKSGELTYLFVLKYFEEPQNLFFSYSPKSENAFSSKELAAKATADNQVNSVSIGEFREVEKKAEQVIMKRRELYAYGSIDRKVVLALENVYLSSGCVYLKISVSNSGNSTFVINSFGFSLNNQSVIQPIFIFNEEVMEVASERQVTKVFVFEQSKLNQQKLIVELQGATNSKKMKFLISPKEILSANKI